VTEARIVVVGGGSQAFGPELCESLIDYGRDVLSGSEVVLLDIREDHLDLVNGFAQRLADEVGAKITFQATTDRRKAFDGADYIINTFRPGSHREQELDETIPVKYGLQGNETIGIGGIFMACRGVPVLREILADAEELCPDAWILNYTNPTQLVADAIQRLSSMRVISLCDGQWDVIDDLAYVLEVEPERIKIHPAGTNHAFWVMRFTVDGEDGYPLLRARVAELTQADIDRMFRDPAKLMEGSVYTYDQMYKQFIRHYGFDFSLRLFELYGLLPGPKYYWRYLLDQDAMIEEQRRPDYVTMAGFYMEHKEPKIFAGLDQRFAKATARIAASKRVGVDDLDADLSTRVIASMVDDLDACLVVNVRNDGAISNLPDEAIVEVSALIGRDGARPFAEGPLPKELVGFQYALVKSQQLTVAAAISGNREDLLKAIVAHPLINSVDAAERCMDDMLERLGPWLPQFYGG
jgi:6-phospho-beta-glucosidase